MTIKKQDSNLFDIQEYQFGEFQNTTYGVEDFEFGEIDKNVIQQRENLDNNIKPQQEFSNASSSGFEVEEVVSRFRRHDDYKKKRIETEVNEKIEAVKEQFREEAFEEGYAKGQSIAKEEHEERMSRSYQDFQMKTKELFEMLENEKQTILNEYKKGILKAMSSITKWMILKESEYDTYTERLLTHLLKELDNFKNLSISFDQANYDKYKPILEKVSEAVPELKDYKVKSDLHLRHNGIKVENDKTILEFSVEKQFEKVDAIFQKIANDESTN